jgi:hypothetical protein
MCSPWFPTSAGISAPTTSSTSFVGDPTQAIDSERKNAGSLTSEREGAELRVPLILKEKCGKPNERERRCRIESAESLEE